MVRIQQLNEAATTESSSNFPEGEKCPVVGMIFESFEEVYDLYKRFANWRGFRVVKSSVQKGKDDKPKVVTLACQKERHKIGKQVNGIRPKRTSINGCKARVRVSRGTNGQWKVTLASDEHNHPLNPETTTCGQQHRVVSANAKQGEKETHEIQDSPSIEKLVEDAGPKKDCKDHGDEIGRSWRLGRGDAKALQGMFIKIQRKDSDFFYDIGFDDEGHEMKNVLWIDGRSQAAYKEFHDVIYFDTTYSTNRYHLPFALFMGVNHHRELILLGCALISDYQAKTYSWVLNSWLKCMENKAPDVIITDQCRSMKRAIKEALPNSKHQWCFWHILSKFSEEMKQNIRYAEMREKFKEVVHESVTRKKFNQKWCKFISEFDVAENEWLSSLFKEKETWVPAYLSDNFSAGIHSTQRSESIHSYFEFVHSNCSLQQFVEQYENVIKNNVEEEKNADHESTTFDMSTIINFEWEKQVKSLYTKEMYLIFREEVKNLIYCSTREPHKLDEALHHRVVEIKCKEGKTCESKYFNVVLDVEKCKVNCSCHYFERVGILCRHILSVLVINKVQELPNDYILRRWRKDVERPYTNASVTHISEVLKNCRQSMLEVENTFYDKIHVALADEGLLAELKKTLLEFVNKANGGHVKDGIGGITATNRQCVASNDQGSSRLGIPFVVARKKRSLIRKNKTKSADEVNCSPKKKKRISDVYTNDADSEDESAMNALLDLQEMPQGG